MNIEGTGGPGSGSQFADLMKNVSELEAIHKKGGVGRIEVTECPETTEQGSLTTFRGRKVVKVKPRKNLFKRLLDFFTLRKSVREIRAIQKRDAEAVLHDQVLMALRDKHLDTQDRNRLINAVATGVIPGFSQEERQGMREKTLSHLESLNVFQGPESIGMMLNEAEDGVKAFPKLIDTISSVSLYDAREAIKGYYTTLLLAPERIPVNSRLHQDIAKLEEHFKVTRQLDGFRHLVNEVIEEVIHSLPERLSDDEYSQLLANWSHFPDTNRDRALARVIDKTFTNVTRKEPSIHGHPRELVQEKTARFIDAMRRDPELESRFGLDRIQQLIMQLAQDKAQVTAELERLSDEVTRLDVEAIRERLKAGEALTREERELIAESRRVLLDIQLTAGRRWDMAMLLQPDIWIAQEEEHEKLLKIQEIGTLRGEEVDLAQLDWLIRQHDEARTHPRVAIEGAGPAGLTLALSQFEAGANVAIFEKRSTEYDRVQVVRLDPKWLDMLKFYLGEHYYELFGAGEESKGIIRPDGFGEITIHRLEEALHDRLTELMGRNYDKTSETDQPLSLERMAAYELEEVESGEEGFKVRARYNPEYDVAQQGRAKDHTPEEAVKYRPVDILICAGGKNTQLRGKFMEDKVLVRAEPYGVCSWEGKKGAELPSQKLDRFQDFREMVVFDKEFHEHFRESLSKELLLLSEPADSIKGVVDPKDLLELEFKTMNRVMQTRCFENKNLVYIGMELPKSFGQYCKKLEGKIKRNLSVSVTPGSGIINPEEANKQAEKKAREAVKAVQKAWFQAVAHYYGIDDSRSLGATSDKINHKFASAFSVQQHRVEKSVVTRQADGHELTVTVAGDAAVSPHFMSYSGLTGAREHVLQLQEFTQKTANDVNPSDRLLHREELEQRQRRTADFVIQRGKAFLGRN